MNPFKRKLRLLREEMKEQGIDVYIIPNTDPHLGENIPDHWRIVQWLSGFTGSTATLLVTKSFAGLWTDSRYFLQAEKQLDGTGFIMMKFDSPWESSMNEWLKINLKKSGLIAFDGRIFSADSFRRMRDALQIKQPVFATDIDLISSLWESRPPLSDSVAFELPPEFSGMKRELKIEMVREEMKKRNISHHLLNSPDDIMWLLNIRGSDVRFSPLLVCRAIVGLDQVLLFTDEKKIPFRLSHEFDTMGIVILPYDEVNTVLASLSASSTLLISPSDTSVSLSGSVPETLSVITDLTIPSRMKSIKNPTEKENIRRAMIKDGVALTRFLFWIEKNMGKQGITEESAAKKLLELRLHQTNCTGESFATIVAFNDHGSLPHYSFSDNPGTYILPGGVLLVDSGGQYLDGTTDITRCISLGEPSLEQKMDFTLALKGTIGLAMARFPSGTRGSQLDILARKALWERGLNYGHGTGHGVGFFLNVHENPPSISPSVTERFNFPLEAGMIVSDEPAIYRENMYGFRTENLLLIEEDIVTEFGQFLKFETLTLCYIDLSLVETSLLEENEIRWLNRYHTSVFEKLNNFLDQEERRWLKGKTKEIKTG